MNKIELQYGHFAIVDDEDYDFLMQYKWRLATLNIKRCYVVSVKILNGKRVKIYMHREVMRTKEDQIVDHINHDVKDNRKENLRNINKVENHKNIVLQSNNTSGCCGVYFRKKTGKYYSMIKINNKLKSLGTFNTKEEAINSRKEANIKYGFNENHGKEFKFEKEKIKQTYNIKYLNSKFGIAGVTFVDNRYVSNFYKNKKREYLGAFKTLFEASCVIKIAENNYFNKLKE